MLTERTQKRLQKELYSKIESLDANQLRNLVIALVEREYEEGKMMNNRYSVDWAINKAVECIEAVKNG